MSVFEPTVVFNIIRNSLPAATRKKFKEEWDDSVAKRVDSWKKNRMYQSQSKAQFVWAAHVIEYVNFLWRSTRVHGNAKTVVSSSPKPLDKAVPLLGPRFLPPGRLHEEKRHGNLLMKPDSYYLKPLTTIHPFYWPRLSQCPACDSFDILFDGWTATGYREVHGLFEEETALGYQLRCKACEERSKDARSTISTYCFATTSSEFWARVQHWDIPRGIPIFLKRSALTRDLFDVILECRLNGTAGGLAESIKQLHLIEYHRRRLEYYRNVGEALSGPSVFNIPITQFSEPFDICGYNGTPISDDLISDVYAAFSDHTRREESSRYLRTLPATTLSIDATFKFAKKASIVMKTEQGKEYTTPMKGGVLSGINQSNETVVWRFCQTQAGAEATEMLLGVKRRCEELGVDDPRIVTADNCCAVRTAVEAAMPNTKVVLDVFHMQMRYLGAIQNGMKNPNYKMVGRDISGAILKTRAEGGTPAQYWPQAEQESQLVAVFEKWARHGGVWSSSAQKVHDDQLRHVQKGCLARDQNDIASDGSRIEGSHKAWNSVMRAQPSGLVTMHNCGHDLVLRRNVRIGSSSPERLAARPFLASGYGSHHISLVDKGNALWNNILARQPAHASSSGQKLVSAPVLPDVNSGETFGIVSSPHATTFGGLLVVKEELEEDLAGLSLIDDDSINDDNKPTTSEDDIRTSSPLSQHDRAATFDNTATTSGPASSARHSTPGSDSHVQSAVGSISTTAIEATRCGLVKAELRDVPPRHIIDLTTDDARPNSEHSYTQTSTAENPTILSDDEDLQPSGLRLGPVKRKHRDDVPVVDSISLEGPVAKRIKVTAQLSLSLTKEVKLDFAPAHQDLYSIFKPRQELTTATIPGPSNVLPPAPCTLLASLPAIQDGLTPSARLFTRLTKLDARTLTLSTSAEFFLFMSMRKEFQWATFSMSPGKWAVATAEYNRRLGASTQASKKHPRALINKLADIEPNILNRLATKNFTSKRGNEGFWKEHCYAVNLGKHLTDVTQSSSRKTMICSRCKTLMYPNPSSKAKVSHAHKAPGSAENHKKSMCSDGAPIKPNKAVKEVPPWPQPLGIFTNGTHFHVIPFLRAVQDLYAVVVQDKSAPQDLDVERQAFSDMLTSRTRVDEPTGKVLFRLFDGLEIAEEDGFESSISVENGRRLLRIDCLGGSVETAN